jgi:hypothetical protein
LGFEGLSLAEIRAAVILHELGHVLGGAIRPDLNNPAESQRNSERVRLTCFLIPNLLRGRGPLSTPTEVPGNSPLLRPPIGGGGAGGGPILYGGGGDPFDVFRWLDLWYEMEKNGGGYGEVIGYHIDPQKN